MKKDVSSTLALIMLVINFIAMIICWILSEKISFLLCIFIIPAFFYCFIFLLCRKYANMKKPLIIAVIISIPIYILFFVMIETYTYLSNVVTPKTELKDYKYFSYIDYFHERINMHYEKAS